MQKIDIPEYIGGVPITILEDYEDWLFWNRAMGCLEEIFAVRMTRDGFENYIGIRKMFPGVYPSVEFEISIMKSIRTMIIKTLMPSIGVTMEDLQSYVKFKVDHNGEGNDDDLRYPRKKLIAMRTIVPILVYCAALKIMPVLFSFIELDGLVSDDIELLDSDVNRRVRWAIESMGAGNWHINDLVIPQDPFSGPETLYLKAAMATIKQYRDRGFEWRYFMFYNAKDPAVQASQKSVKLSPDIFEIGAAEQFPIADQQRMLERLVGPYRDSNAAKFPWNWQVNGAPRKAAPFTTWTKAHIVKAIMDSGLAVKFERPYRRKIAGVPIERLNIDPNIAIGRLKYVPIGLNDFIRDERHPTAVPSSEQRLWKYIATYRRLFNTMSYIDWMRAFNNGMISDAELPRVAKEFAIDPTLPPDVLKQRIADISKKRVSLASEIAELLPEQSQVIILQPGSAWVKPVTRYQFKGSELTLMKPYEKFVTIKMMCADDNIDKDEFISRLEIAGGVLNLVPPTVDIRDPRVTKSDLCDILLEHLQYEADKYDKLTFDCNDPDISIQSILNALELLDLKDLVKDIELTELRKGDLCKIINNYLDILMEQKAKTIAQSSNLNSNN